MRVISKARLKAFWEEAGRHDAEGPLKAWYGHVNSPSVAWQTWSDVKAAIRSASIVGNCIVFNIGGNKYRLITRVLFRSQKVFILKVMTHIEYDHNRWKEDCGCFQPPPSQTSRKSGPRKQKGA